MTHKKTVNGHTITLKKWDNILEVENMATGELTEVRASDYIQALIMFKAI